MRKNGYLGCVLSLLLCGCATIEKAAMRRVAGIFAGDGGANAFVQDDDPELVRDAMPFALKTYETLLAADPENRDLYLATASGFVQYANAFVEADAERIEGEDYRQARHLRQRAVNLYLRGRDYGLDGLALADPDLATRVRKHTQDAVAQWRKEDVPLIYWTAAGWAGAIAAEPGNMARVAELPVVEAMMRRALELDPDFDHGALHEFFVVYEGGRSEAMGGSLERAMAHFDRVVELTEGKKASPYVSLASTVAVGQQDYAMFKDLLDEALAIDPGAVPNWKLANTLAQEKAQWLLSRSADLFVDYEGVE